MKTTLVMLATVFALVACNTMEGLGKDVTDKFLAGLPGISVPCGLSEGLPVGLQVIGRAFDEATVLRIADAYERAAGFSDLRPPLATDG